MTTMTETQLRGSEKQIAWAEEIRAKMIGEIDEAFARITRKIAALSPELSAEGKAIQELLIAAIAKVKGQSQASWWIDHRPIVKHAHKGWGLVMGTVKDVTSEMSEEDADAFLDRIDGFMDRINERG